MSTNEEAYQAPPEFEEDAKDPLLSLSSTDSTELWLIQWPLNQHPDFDGQEVSLKLHHDGSLGSFTSSSGKQYEVVSYKSQEPDASVFISSPSESKIVGKISRRVCLVHYPEPDELKKQDPKDLSEIYQRSVVTSMTNSSHYSPSMSQGTYLRNSRSSAGRPTSTHSSRSKSTLSEAGEQSKSSTKKRRHESTGFMNRSQDSGRGHSSGISSESVEHTHQRKSKKIKQEA